MKQQRQRCERETGAKEIEEQESQGCEKKTGVSETEE